MHIFNSRKRIIKESHEKKNRYDKIIAYTYRKETQILNENEITATLNLFICLDLKILHTGYIPGMTNL